MSHDRIIDIIERANQRGGRMLSVVDLIRAGTLSVAQVCRALEHIENGSSWLVGAAPGGAGKTTVMAALLAMLPPGETAVVARDRDWDREASHACITAFEISPGTFDGYIWGRDVRTLFRLAAAGRRIVANLHADTVEEARRQVVSMCGVPPEQFARCGMFLPISLQRTMQGTLRRIERIRTFDGDRCAEADTDAGDSPRRQEIATFIDECQKRRFLTCAEVRKAWHGWLREHPARG